jgi:alpha-glucosidase
MLALYRAAVRMRHAEPDLRSERQPMRWLDSPPGVLAFRRGQSTVCMVNLSPESVALPPGSSVLLSSGPVDDGVLGTDAAVWLQTACPASRRT